MGAVSYLNARPLTSELDLDASLRPILYSAPSAIADWLRKDEIDLGLVPMVEASSDPRYRIVPGYCIAARGAAQSILLFHRAATLDWRALKRIGIDSSSRSSAELLRVLLHMRGNSGCTAVEVSAELRHLQNGAGELDALLLIGDAALAAAKSALPRADLAQVWWEQTQLPFVFALWLGREGVDPRALAAVRLAASRGLAKRRELAAEFCRAHPGVMTAEAALRYLTESIRYELGAAELQSIALFHSLRAEAGHAGSARWQPCFFELPG